ncbi:BTAD domain-containing putative transcriptional regulator [Paenibacillus sp. GCM10027626]|uniref:AfsR/SARP family transcriptional regulator n=1 Tax=Paenibacillus sp. GCM10027626 TaxID=3273411 RepID=UPI00363EA787
MGQRNELSRQKDACVNELLALEQAILDGQMLSVEKLQAIPVELRKKSPLLLQAECEDGLLQGKLFETKQLLETALKGFAAQANESAMLAMMGMLGLLYEQAGDQDEAMPIVILLIQEWERNPEGCSGFVPWALARAALHGERSLTVGNAAADSDLLYLSAVERFGKEARPLWAAFVMLDRLLHDPQIGSDPSSEWRLRLDWLDRHLQKDELGLVLRKLLTTAQADSGMIAYLPARYAYLVRVVLMKERLERPEQPEASDIQIQFYAAAAAAERLAQEGEQHAAQAQLAFMQRLQKQLDTAATRQRLLEVTAALSVSSSSPSSEHNLSGDLFAPRSSAIAESKAMPDRKWRIKLMGDMRFSSTDGLTMEPVWKRRRAGELLVFLLLQPGYKANRELLLERVFIGGAADKRSNQLYVTLHDLRHTLKEMGLSEAVYAKRGVIGLDEQVIDQIDVESYVALSRVGDQLWMDDREAACRLYDEAMPLYGSLASELPQAEWLSRLREQLLDRQTNLLKRLAFYYSELQDDVRAEQRLNEWIALRPDQEEAYEMMIRHCLAKGHRAEAINWYRRLERICKDELGIEPLEATRSLIWE